MATVATLNIKNGLSDAKAYGDLRKLIGAGPDVISLQEIGPRRAKRMRSMLREAGYDFHAGKGSAPIAYRRDKFKAIERGSRFLTPATHVGKAGAGPSTLRAKHANYVVLRNKKTGRVEAFTSAHLAPSKNLNDARRSLHRAQVQGLADLQRDLARKHKGVGRYLLGDLNTGKREDLAPLRQAGLKLYQAPEGTFRKGSYRPDWIISDVDRTGARVADGFSSDHNAYFSSFGNDRLDLDPKVFGGAPTGGGAGGGGGVPRNRRRRGRDGGGGGGGRLKDYAADYGWSMAFLRDNPALKKVFDKAIDNNWSPQRFVAEIQDTPWFKKHSDTWRQAEYLAATDPKTYNQRRNQIRQSIADQAGALGIELSGKLLSNWSEQAIRLGWTDEQVRNHLASQVKIMGEHTVGGELAATQEQLNRWAADNGVAINKKTMQGWLRQIVRGGSTFEEFKQYITKMAVAQHPNWAKELQAGMSIAEIADPYRNMAAQLLEVAPEEVDMSSRLIKEALSYKREDGSYDSMTMYDFEDKLRQDPRWQKTDNAKEQYMQTGSAVLRMFGLST